MRVLSVACVVAAPVWGAHPAESHADPRSLWGYGYGYGGYYGGYYGGWPYYNNWYAPVVGGQWGTGCSATSDCAAGLVCCGNSCRGPAEGCFGDPVSGGDGDAGDGDAGDGDAGDGDAGDGGSDAGDGGSDAGDGDSDAGDDDDVITSLAAWGQNCGGSVGCITGLVCADDGKCRGPAENPATWSQGYVGGWPYYSYTPYTYSYTHAHSLYGNGAHGHYYNYWR